ncbi:MAG: YHS domain-containing protein [Chloroflexi bacterium]|nr:YHS domain-containing protein [Chloroflexota bacterium]
MHGVHWFDVCCIGIALFVASNLWFYVRVLRPVRQLALSATQLTGGRLDAFEKPCGGITEIRQLRLAMAGMAGHVRRAQEQSRVYTESLADGLEHERKHLARELHDDAVQSIIAVTRSIDLARNWVRTEPDKAVTMLQAARQQAVEVVNTLRQLIGGLRPPALEELGLVAALKMHVDAIETLDVSLKIEGAARRMDEPRELTLFRAAQEALANVVRHSGAARAMVCLSYGESCVELTVRDDGRGFQLPAQLGDLAFRHHYGLLGIRERVTSLGGMLKIESTPGQGSAIHVHLPTEAPRPLEQVVDPVCGAALIPRQAYGRSEFEGKTYFFCCPVCQGAFEHEPARYTRSSQNAE